MKSSTIGKNNVDFKQPNFIPPKKKVISFPKSHILPSKVGMKSCTTFTDELLQSYELNRTV